MERHVVALDAEDFGMQRAYLYALTIRNDISPEGRKIIEKIERKLAGLAGVKSVFDVDKE